MKCSLSSKNSPRNTVDFEAACSVYIRFRGVNGYERSPSLNKSEDLRTTAEGNVEAPGCWHEICVYYGIVDEGWASMEHAVTSCVKTNKPVNSGWSLENQWPAPQNLVQS